MCFCSRNSKLDFREHMQILILCCSKVGPCTGFKDFNVLQSVNCMGINKQLFLMIVQTEMDDYYVESHVRYSVGMMFVAYISSICFGSQKNVAMWHNLLDSKVRTSKWKLQWFRTDGRFTELPSDQKGRYWNSWDT